MKQFSGSARTSSASIPTASQSFGVTPLVLTHHEHQNEEGAFPPSIASAVDFDWTKNWPEIRRRIVASPKLLVALGFDGILSPTVPRPDEATVPEDIRRLLTKLNNSPQITLAFLSGRSLGNFQVRVGIPDAFYAGNHGMEICGPGLSSFDGLAASCRSDLVDALAFLARCTKRLQGVLIEDKGMSVTVHFRLANTRDRVALRGLMEIIVQNHPRLRSFPGEECWDLRARASWNKGDALRQLLAHLHLTSTDTIYIGDEFTDEDAFTWLTDGLTFCVGSGVSRLARYRLPDRAHVAQFLSSVLSEVNNTQREEMKIERLW
ncbi:MAG TPA: trehalose-phosphatase [Chthoniobacter sp.]|jgi:trehalose-phosphatase